MTTIRFSSVLECKCTVFRIVNGDVGTVVDVCVIGFTIERLAIFLTLSLGHFFILFTSNIGTRRP